MANGSTHNVVDLGSNVLAKVATGASYSGAAGITYMGFTADEWGVIGIVSGIGFGFLTWVSSVAINVYFKSQHLRLAREKDCAMVDE